MTNKHHLHRRSRSSLMDWDFIESSVARLAQDPSDQESRESVVLLAIGIELLLKSCLRGVHWSLVFEDVDHANEVDLAQGSFRSARPDQCIDRLLNICRIEVPTHLAAQRHQNRQRGRADDRARRDLVAWVTSFHLPSRRRSSIAPGTRSATGRTSTATRGSARCAAIRASPPCFAG